MLPALQTSNSGESSGQLEVDPLVGAGLAFHQQVIVPNAGVTQAGVHPLDAVESLADLP